MEATSFSRVTHTYHTIGSAPIQVDAAWRPEAWDASKGHKTLVFFHGGGLISGNRAFRFPGLPHKLLMQRGWLILSADYRLLPESGIAEVIEDTRNLEEWIMQEGEKLGADLGRIAVGGSSAGCFVSILAISTWSRLRPRVFYSLYGMLNSSDSWYSTRKDDETLLMGVPARAFQEKDVGHYLAPGNQTVWDDATELGEPGSRSALFLWLLKEGKIGPMITTSFSAATGKECLFDLLTSSFPPTVALHGTSDSITPVTDSRKLAQKLAGLGVQGHVIEAEGADHGVNPQDKFHKEFEKSVDLVDQLLDQ